MQGGWWGATPFIAMTALAPLGGWVSDRAAGNFGRRRGRQIGAWIGMGLSGVFLWTGGHVNDTTLAILLLSLGAGFNFFGWAAYWAACIDLAPALLGFPHRGNEHLRKSGRMAIAHPHRLCRRADGMEPGTGFEAFITLLGALLWLFIDADRSIERASERTLEARPTLAATRETAAGP